MRLTNLVVLSVVATGCSLLTPLDGLGSSGLQPGPDASNDTSTDAPFVDAGPDRDAGPKPVGAFAFADVWGTAARLESVAALSGGGYVVGGSYQLYSSDVVVGSYFLPKPSGLDALVVATDAKGNVTGTLGFGGSTSEVVTAVAAGAGSTIFVAGSTFGATTLNGAPLPMGWFIAALDATDLKKAPPWVRPLQGAWATVCPSCLAATVDGVLALVRFGPQVTSNPTLDFGDTVTTNGGDDLVLVKLGTTGLPQWKRQIGSVGDETPGALRVDASGGVYLTAGFAAALVPNQAFATPPPPVGSTSTLLVAKFSSTGAPVWNKTYGDKNGGSANAPCIASDGSGHVAVGINFSGGLDLGLGTIGASGGDGIVISLDESKLSTLWQTQIGAADVDSIAGCGFDPWGHVAVVGRYRQGPKLGSFTLPPSDLDAPFVAKLSPSGEPEWAHGYPRLGVDGGPTYGEGPAVTSLAIGTDGKVVFAGEMKGYNDFGGGTAYTITNVKGYGDALLVGLTP